MEQCPRCGGPLYDAGERRGGRGRPRRWCSAECRKLAGEDRRAANRRAIRVEIALPVERGPLLPERAIERVSSNPIAIEQLLRALAHRMRAISFDSVDRRNASRVVPLLADLLDAYRRATGMPVQCTGAHAPAPSAPQRAVADVLASPRATKDLLDALTGRAETGELLARQHSGTVAAAQRLVRALAESRTIR